MLNIDTSSSILGHSCQLECMHVMYTKGNMQQHCLMPRLTLIIFTHKNNPSIPQDLATQYIWYW